jgi:N-acetylglutamate synthase-like GNAT family acetyltransferase
MRTRLKLRGAVADDVAGIGTLIAHLGYPVREDALLRTLGLLHDAPGHHAVVVAELDGVVCGLLVMSPRPSLTLQGTVGVVQELVVHPAHRGREIGEGLLQYAKGLAAERGLSRLECEVAAPHQPVADRFLMERGFEVAETRTYRWSVLEDKYPRLPVSAAARPLRPIPA